MNGKEMTRQDWIDLNSWYFKLVRPIQNPVLVKYVKDLKEFDNIPGLQLYDNVGPVCQAIGRCGYEDVTLGVRSENFHLDYCRGVNGIFDRDERWYSGEALSKGWFDGVVPSKAHSNTMLLMPTGHKGVIVSSMGNGALLDPGAICLQMTPAATFMLLSGYVHKNFEKLEFTFTGESSCADSWITTIVEGKIGLSFGCRGERAFGQLAEQELRITMTAEHLIRCLDGMESLKDKGLTYPFASEALFADILANPFFPEWLRTGSF